MTTPNKVKAGAGAEWLLGGFGLLKKAPLALGLVGLVFAIVLSLPILLSPAGVGAVFAGQLVMVLLTPALMGGLTYAVREVDQDRGASPGQLLQGFREGKTLALMAMLIPQILALLLVLILLAAIVGPTGLQNLAVVLEQAQAQADPDPALFQGIPAGGLLLWLLLSLVIGIVVFALTLLFVPQVMFAGRTPLEALKRSFAACVRNIPALLVFIVLFVIVAIVISIGAYLVALIALVFGQVAMQVAAQLLMTAVIMPVYAGAIFYAWRQLLDDGAPVAADAPPPPSSSGIEV